MKIALYARVSTEAQTKDGTIESQIEALREYAKVHKLNIAFECLDDGYSGTRLDRPGLDQLRDLAQSGSIEGILILSPDRFSRKQANQILLIEEFKKHNVRLIFTNQNFSDSPEDNLMLNIQGAISEYERVKILDRLRRGAIHSTKKGQVNGSNPPIGYSYIPKTSAAPGHWEINPEEAKTINYIFDLFLNRKMKGFQIAKILNDEHVPSRSLFWRPSLIYDILKNSTYAGTAYMFKNRAVEPKKSPKAGEYRKVKNSSKSLRPRDEWISVPVSPIIDKDTWDRVQDLRKQNVRRSKRNNLKNNYLFRGLVVCGLCGSMAPGYVSNRSTYYSCGSKRNRNLHTKRHDELIQVSHPAFDEKVWTGLTQLLSDPKQIKAQLENRMQAKKAKPHMVQATSEFDAELAQLATQEKRILDAYRESVIGLEDLKFQKEKIASRRAVLEAKKKAVPSHTEGPGQPKITMEMLGDVSARFQRVMAKADFPTRERLVNLLVNSVTLTTDKAIVAGNIPVSNLDVLNRPRIHGDV